MSFLATPLPRNNWWEEGKMITINTSSEKASSMRKTCKRQFYLSIPNSCSGPLLCKKEERRGKSKGDKNTVKVGKEHEQDTATKPQHKTGRNQPKTM